MWKGAMTPVGFEPTQLALVELESTPLDHSGKVSRLALDTKLIELMRQRGARAAPPGVGSSSPTCLRAACFGEAVRGRGGRGRAREWWVRVVVGGSAGCGE